MRYIPSHATLLRPLLCWVRCVPPRTASRQQLAATALVDPHRQLAATALVGPHQRLATVAHVDHSPLLTTSALVGSHRQLTTATASALVVNGSGYRCQHTRRLSSSACKWPRSFLLTHGQVATLLPYVRYRDMPLMAHISTTNVASILQGTQPSVVHAFDK